MKLRFRGDRVQEDIAILHAVRNASPDLTIMVDANQGHGMPGSQRIAVWDMKTALSVANALTELEVAWLEEPLPRRHFRELAELTRMARLPFAGGELNLRIEEFTIIIAQRCYDIIQAGADFTHEGRDRLLASTVTVNADGMVRLPDQPGLGIELNDLLTELREE